ncbi:hypothetical protein OXX80_012859, partial [Metschnikowia pulcherrima]
MSVALVNGTSAVTLYAPESVLFSKTIDFYSNLVGFSVAKKEDSRALLASETGVSVNVEISEKSSSGDEIAAQRQKFTSEASSSDWRARGSHVTLAVSSLNSLISALRASGESVQVFPNELYPTEAYVIDPLGHLVGFTSSENLLTLNPKVEKLEQP